MNKAFLPRGKDTTSRSFLSIMPQYIRLMREPIVNGLQFSTLLASFPCFAIRIVPLLFNAFDFNLLINIKLNRIFNISLMSCSEVFFLSVPSGPEAVFFLGWSRHSVMSCAVMAWNIAPISKALWPVPMTVKGMVVSVVVPHRASCKDCTCSGMDMLILHPPAIVHLRGYIWPADLVSCGRDHVFLHICISSILVSYVGSLVWVEDRCLRSSVFVVYNSVMSVVL